MRHKNVKKKMQVVVNWKGKSREKWETEIEAKKKEKKKETCGKVLKTRYYRNEGKIAEKKGSREES